MSLEIDKETAIELFKKAVISDNCKVTNNKHGHFCIMRKHKIIAYFYITHFHSEEYQDTLSINNLIFEITKEESCELLDILYSNLNNVTYDEILKAL